MFGDLLEIAGFATISAIFLGIIQRAVRQRVHHSRYIAAVPAFKPVDMLGCFVIKVGHAGR